MTSDASNAAEVPAVRRSWVERLSTVSATRVAWAVGLLGAVVFGNALFNGFAYDDVSVIVRDPGLQAWGGLPARLLEPSWPQGQAQELGAWRPLTTGLWGVTWLVTGGAPWAFHLLGLLLHGICAALVVLLVAELAPVGIAALAGLVFAVHPVHTEAIANVVGTTEALAAAFALAACWVYARGELHDSRTRWLLVAALYAAALLSKESAAPLPAALLLVDAFRRDLRIADVPDYLRGRWRTFGSLAVVLALVLAGRWAVLGAVASSPLPLGAAWLTEVPRAWTVVSAWTEYSRLLLIPLSLSPDYSPAMVPVLFDLTGRVLWGALLVGLWLGFAGVAWRVGAPPAPHRASARLFGLGVVWTALMLLPVANVFFMSPVLVSERALYLPSVGFAMAAGWVLFALLRRQEAVGLALAVLVLGGFALRTVTRTPTWRSTDTVFTALKEQHPENGRAQWVLANELFARGQVREGLRAYAYAMNTLDSDYPLLVDLGLQMSRLDRPGPAEALLRSAWAADPTKEAAPRVLAAVLREQGRAEEAVLVARRALPSVADSIWLLDQLSVALSAIGSHAEAVEVRRAVLEGGLGERWPWWMAHAEDLAALEDSAGLRQALDTARALARGEGAEALRSFESAEARILGHDSIAAGGESR